MNLTLPSIAPSPALMHLRTESAECSRNADYSRQIEVLQRLRQLNPGDHRISLELGAAYSMLYDFAAAERSFENAIGLAPVKTEALMAAGHYWRRVRNHAAAADCYQRVLEHPFVPIAALIRLAEFHERTRDLEKASEILERALHLYPRDGGALLLKACLFRQRKQFGEAESLVRWILSQPSCAMVHSATYDELGMIMDGQGRYDEAMSACLAGKALMRTEAVRPLDQLRRIQAARKRVTEVISAQMIAKWRNSGESENKTAHSLALLAGHARSGTTLLEYVLDSHPGIVSADETFVFSNKAHFLLGRSRDPLPPIVPTLEALTLRALRQTRSDYVRGMESFLSQPIGDRLLIDKNPVLTPDLLAFYRVFPESKFLIALRDPRDVCLSCFMQSAKMSPDSASWLTVEGAIQNYATIMNVWLALKPHLPNAMEVRYEDMVGDLEGNSRRMLEFLGCAWDERVMRFDEHARSKLIRSPTYADVTKPIYKTAVGRWANYQKYFEPHMEKLAPFLRAFGYE